MFPPHALRRALNNSVTSGVFIDTKLYLFSCRDPSGKVHRPRPLYANSSTLKHVPYFEDLLSGGFAEGVTKNLDHDPFEDSDHVEDYDYPSDSDLEDDVEAAKPGTKNHPPENQNRNPGAGEGFYNELDHEGKVVVLRGVSYLTFRAFLMYLYTGEIDFAPSGSKANCGLRAPEPLSTTEDTIPRPSPKSIYRIADMYDVPILKGLAFAAIRNGIRSCDAIEETFSEFTSRYPEMVDLHVGNLASELLSSNSQDVQERFNQKLLSFATGELPHAANAVSTLFGVLAQYHASENPPETGNTGPQAELKCTWAEGGNQDIPPHRKSMNIALIKSMHCGSFLDMEYRVRTQRIGTDQFASVYLSISVFHDVRSELGAIAHTFDSSEQGEQGVDDDSDYEEDPIPGPMGAGTIDSMQKGHVPERNYLPGALMTWKSLFLYLCFNTITFRPLRSQEASLKGLPARQGTGDALSCSPKSIYRLAQLLGLNLLTDLALDDIINKLTSENIVAELFSKFTAQNDKLREKQSLLLTSTLKTPMTTMEVQRYIQDMASGTLPHRYDALGLAFGNTVKTIKQKIADGQKAREAEYMSRPALRCRIGCNKVLTIEQLRVGLYYRCHCGTSFECSECSTKLSTKWREEDTCRGCKRVFR